MPEFLGTSGGLLLPQDRQGVSRGWRLNSELVKRWELKQQTPGRPCRAEGCDIIVTPSLTSWGVPVKGNQDRLHQSLELWRHQAGDLEAGAREGTWGPAYPGRVLAAQLTGPADVEQS